MLETQGTPTARTSTTRRGSGGRPVWVIAAMLSALNGCCGLCGGKSGGTAALGDECSGNADCTAGLYCADGVCVSPPTPGAPGNTTAETPPVNPSPPPVANPGTVTSGGLELGMHGCTFWDTTGAYNRKCTLTQNADGTVSLRAPGTSLNPDIGFSGTLTGGPEQYGFRGSITCFDSCTGQFSTQLVRDGNKYVASRAGGCGRLTIHILAAPMGSAGGACQCSEGRVYGPEPDPNVANGGCARLGCAQNYACNRSNGNCECTCP